MIYGRDPNRDLGRLPPDDNGMGSLFTSIRDALNPVKWVKEATGAISKVAGAIGFKPLERLANAVDHAANQLDAEASRAGRNPQLIKIAAAVTAAALAATGQVNAAASVLKIGTKYAAGVTAKNDLKKSQDDIKKDNDASVLVNSLIGFMNDADQVAVVNAYNNDGYKGLNNPQILSILNAAKKVRDNNLATNIEPLYPTMEPLQLYINQAISQVLDIDIKNNALKLKTINDVLAEVNNRVTAFPPKVLATLRAAFDKYGGDAFSQKNIAGELAYIPNVIKAGVTIIQNAMVQDKKLPPSPPDTISPIPDNSGINTPVNSIDTVNESLRKYVPLMIAAGIVLKFL